MQILRAARSSDMAVRFPSTRTAQRILSSRSSFQSNMSSINKQHNNELVLYDVPSRPPCQAWSPNTWKVRLLLNYKRLDYKTDWVEFPAIEIEMAKYVPRNTAGPAYTLPVVRFGDDHFVMGSKDVAHEICKRRPSPAIIVDSTHAAKLDQTMPKLYAAIAGTYMSLVPERLLNEPSRLYWVETRERRFGMSLSRLQTERGGDEAWCNAKPYLDEVTAMFGDRGVSQGPFFHGERVSYADFQWGAFLMYIQAIGSDVFERMMDAMEDRGGRVHRDLLAALAPWTSRKN